MTDGKSTGKDPSEELQDLARRFQDLWRDQAAATAADPEFMEMMGKWMAAFAPGAGQGPAMPPATMPGMPPGTGQAAAGAANPAAWMAAMQAAMMGVAGKGGSDDGARSAQPAGAEAAADASGPRHVAGDEFERRLAAIEQRLERLESAIENTGGGTAKGTRRRRS